MRFGVADEHRVRPRRTRSKKRGKRLVMSVPTMTIRSARLRLGERRRGPPAALQRQHVAVLALARPWIDYGARPASERLARASRDIGCQSGEQRPRGVAQDRGGAGFTASAVWTSLPSILRAARRQLRSNRRMRVPHPF